MLVSGKGWGCYGTGSSGDGFGFPWRVFGKVDSRRGVEAGVPPCVWIWWDVG
jgi:hypothetical protein